MGESYEPLYLCVTQTAILNRFGVTTGECCCCDTFSQLVIVSCKTHWYDYFPFSPPAYYYYEISSCWWERNNENTWRLPSLIFSWTRAQLQSTSSSITLSIIIFPFYGIVSWHLVRLLLSALELYTCD